MVQQNSKEVERILSVDISNPCLSSPCLNSGMCITLMDDKGIPRGYLCRCTSPQDSGSFCEDRNFCYSNPCLNGGTCSNTLNGFTCKCTGSWTGFNCNRPSELVNANLNLNCFDEGRRCLNGGSCLKYADEYFYSCKCMPSYSGAQCEIFDVCSTTPCQNGGFCLFKPPSYFECKCTDQFIGLNCEKPNPCSNQTCANGGLCRINYNTNEYFCTCTGNYMGKNCNQCKPQFMGQFCDQCINGFTGANCDQLATFCSPTPCQNGVCLWDPSGYRCVCNEGKIFFNLIEIKLKDNQ